MARRQLGYRTNADLTVWALSARWRLQTMSKRFLAGLGAVLGTTLTVSVIGAADVSACGRWQRGGCGGYGGYYAPPVAYQYAPPAYGYGPPPAVYAPPTGYYSAGYGYSGGYYGAGYGYGYGGRRCDPGYGYAPPAAYGFQPSGYWVPVR